jgi:ELWxxDGT repeat protein
VLVADIAPGPSSSSPAPLARVGNVIYFAATVAGSGRDLWLTDGTAEGTRLAADVAPGSPSSFPGPGHTLGRQLLFVADDGVHGDELWALRCGDGTLDPGEECDQGAANGDGAGCCSETCSLRPGADDCG